MNSLELSKALMQRGLLITLIYIDEENIKRSIPVMYGRCIKAFFPNEKTYKADKYYNICSDEIFDLDNTFPDIVEYNLLPENFDIDNFLKLDFDHLGNNKEYVEKLKNVILDLKVKFNHTYEYLLQEFESMSDDEIFDYFILRFYPKKIKKTKNILKKLKDDIADKFFMYNFEDDHSKENISSIPAFKMFGILNKNINVTDEYFLNALKRRWFDLIEQNKKETIKDVQNTDISFLTGKEQQEFLEELELFKKELDNITFDELNDLKTTKDVIKYWPSILQPKPDFVYED
jgi:hypothetical protein